MLRTHQKRIELFAQVDYTQNQCNRRAILDGKRTFRLKRKYSTQMENSHDVKLNPVSSLERGTQRFVFGVYAA